MDDFAESPATLGWVRVYFKGAREYSRLELRVIEYLVVGYVPRGINYTRQECGPLAALVKQCLLTLKCEATQACQVFWNGDIAIIRR